jgi:hypothetical protein
MFLGPAMDIVRIGSSPINVYQFPRCVTLKLDEDGKGKMRNIFEIYRKLG